MIIPFTKIAITYNKKFWFGFFWNSWWDKDSVMYAQCYLTIIPCFPIIWNVRLKKDDK